MSTLKLKGSTSGYVELTAPATAGNNTITLPTTAGTVAVVNSSGNLLVNTTTSTGTTSQNLQVSGGGYFSGNLGIGITRPTQKIEVSGGAYVSGSVGIGTTNPQYSLDVTGDINFTGTFRQNGSSFVASRWTAGTGNDIYRLNGDVGIGTTNPTSTFQVVGGDSEFEGVIETVGTATTYMVGSGMVLEMDVRRATVYTYTMPTGANIGIVSFKNMPAQTGSPTGSTVTLLVTQNAAGTGNTTAATGIGTNCTVVGYENGASVAGISTRGLVGSAVTTTLSTTGGDIDFVSFFINYTGGTNTAASSYKVYVTKNGGFRRGNVGV